MGKSFTKKVDVHRVGFFVVRTMTNVYMRNLGLGHGEEIDQQIGQKDGYGKPTNHINL